MGIKYKLIGVVRSDTEIEYFINEGINHIGRGYQMDICIQGDLEIARDNHCSIIYDCEKSKIKIIPAKGAISYLNNQLINHMIEMNVNDEIRIGRSCLKLVELEE